MIARHSLHVLAAITIVSSSMANAEANPILLHDSLLDEFLLAWWGEPMEFYFIQESGDLLNWSYMPVFEVGDDDVICWGFRPTAARRFFRLHHTDDPESDLMKSDMDDDGLTVYQEYLLGSDPFNPDTSGDGIFDGIAAKLGTPITPPEAPAADPGDTTAPVITLLHPIDFVPLP